ncbi:MAG: hypothetical protein MUE73_04810 [Planctomycetes bacterium]|jgi:hypothetical protein|nr:hypothetical protein [Planctomycetota bacterium]
MAERVYVHLHPSERSILRAAAQVFSGYAAAGAVTPETEQTLALKAVEIAVRMATLIEERVQCQDEVN